MRIAYEDETNLVRRIGIALIWPILIAIAFAYESRLFARRLYRDALKLIPKKQAAIAPKQVTVEMLAADRGSEYELGQWVMKE